MGNRTWRLLWAAAATRNMLRSTLRMSTWQNTQLAWQVRCCLWDIVVLGLYNFLINYILVVLWRPSGDKCCGVRVTVTTGSWCRVTGVVRKPFTCTAANWSQCLTSGCVKNALRSSWKVVYFATIIDFPVFIAVELIESLTERFDINM